MPELVLMRHGATVWGQENKFAGWGDTALSAKGIEEAEAAGKALARNGFVFDGVITSRLLRAQQTVDVVLRAMNAGDISIRADWRLNERHYGALQGNSRSSMIDQYGNSQVVEWRRSYQAVPPELTDHDPRWYEQLQRLPDVPISAQPRSESMAMAAVRSLAVWDTEIAPQLRDGKRLLVVAHTSSLRGLSKIIHGFDDTASEEFRIATAIPRHYRFDATLNLVDYNDVQSGVKSKLRMWVNRFKPKRWGFA